METFLQLIPASIALVVGVCSLYITFRMARTKASDDRANQLERKIEELQAEQIYMQRDLDECKRARQDLTDQNFKLLSKLYDVEEEQRRRG